MKYYSRTIIIKDYQGKWRKAVYVPCYEYFKTNKEEFVKTANKGKRIKFEETTNKDFIKELRKGEANKIYRRVEQLSNSEIYWRRKI